MGLSVCMTSRRSTSYVHACIAARLLEQAISSRGKVISDLSAALGQLQEELNSKVVLHTAFISSQISEGVDRLGK